MGTLPQDAFAKVGELFAAFHDGQEMVAGQYAHFTGKLAAAIGKQDFGFAQAPWVEQDVAACRIDRVVLVFQAGLEIGERNLHRLVTPAGMNDLTLIWQSVLEPGTGFWGVSQIKSRLKREWASDDLDGFHEEFP